MTGPAETTWYAARLVFRHGGEEPATYEERITLWRAADFDAAIALAEAEAEDYAPPIDAEYLSMAQAYHLPHEPEHGAEVFSLMRDSELAPDSYLAAFFTTGSEHQAIVDEPSNGPDADAAL